MAGPDRRRFPANARVAAERLRATVAAPAYSAGMPARVIAPVTDLLAAPAGARDRQLLAGAALRIYEVHQGWAFVEAEADGYTGYLRATDLGDARPAPTHRVSARATHAYSKPDLKSPELLSLSYASLVTVTARANGFAETHFGHLPEQHLSPLATPPSEDPVTLAETLLGTPYLWGGNSAFGLDCSALVQLPLQILGRPCPGDSDMQAAELGSPLPEAAPLQRGDLLFWKGHVAWVAAPDRILHANAGSMSTAFEDLSGACARIRAAGDGDITTRRRLG